MLSHSRTILGTIAGIAILMVFILGFHVGGPVVVRIGLFSPLLGAFIGGTLTLISVQVPLRRDGNSEPWLNSEQLAWTLIGCGCIAWGIGECFWRYNLAQGITPFPSLADFGYASFPPLVFLGLILQPSSKSEQKRVFFLLDSLIAMGALLSIAWFLLLGPFAQTPAESVFAKVLGFYYPTMDVALLSCAIFLMLRGSDRIYQARARRIGLLVAVLGLAIFATSDFIFNLQELLGTYTDGTWIDLGWPLGIMTLGIAAYLRRFLPATPDEVLDDQLKRRTNQYGFEPVQALPYLLLVTLFCVLIFNVLSADPMQRSIRSVLAVATMIVVILVIARQVLTSLENARLLQSQMATLQKLEVLNQNILERNTSLEAGVAHLKEVQTRLANGEVRARASAVNGELWSLAVGLNLMADRMMRIENNQRHVRELAQGVDDFSQALMRMRSGSQFVLPPSCANLPEIHRIIQAMGLKPGSQQPTPATPARPSDSGSNLSSSTIDASPSSAAQHNSATTTSLKKGGIARLKRDNLTSP